MNSSGLLPLAFALAMMFFTVYLVLTARTLD